MAEIPLHEIDRGMIVKYDCAQWLVLGRGLAALGHWPASREFTLEKLPKGPIRHVRLRTRDWIEILPDELRKMQFVCWQKGKLLLFDQASNEMIEFREDRTAEYELNPGELVDVKYFRDQPVWILGKSSVADQCFADRGE